MQEKKIYNMAYSGAAKIESHQENPFDRVLIGLSDVVAPTLRNAGFTPNMLTTICVVASYFAVRSLQSGDKPRFVLWALIGYFFDCLDGHFARKYNMCTLFGDFYDHITDWIYYAALMYVAFITRGLKPQFVAHRWIIIIGLIVLACLMMWHFGCQETLHAKRTTKPVSPTLNLFKRLCGKNPEESVKTSRWFGCGTFNVVLAAIIVIACK